MSASVIERERPRTEHPMDVPVETKRRSAVRVLAAAAAALALIVIVQLLRRNSPAITVDRATLATAHVERGTLVREVRGTGSLVAEHSRIIAADTTGSVEALRARAGQHADAATVVLVLSNAEAVEQATAAKATLSLAEAELAGAEASIAQQLLSIRAEAARLEGESEEAVARLQSLRRLADEQLAAQTEVHLAEVRATAATTRAALAQKQLSAAERGVRAQLAAMQARVEQSRALLESRQRIVDSLQVRALFSGIVQELLVEPGQHVEPGTNLARIADPTAMIARIQVPPAQARDVAPGLEARVDTHSGVVAGRVARVDPSVREGTVAVEIELTGALPAGSRPDSPVEATIVAGRVSDAVLVRRPAGAADGSSIDVFRLDPSSGEGRRTRVLLGRGSASAVEVLDGLKPGEEIVISDTSAWQEYDRIRIR
jgi:HlyD family secretion protein